MPQRTIKQLIGEVATASQATGVDVSTSDVGFIISLFFEGMANDKSTPEVDPILQRIADEAASVRDEG